MFGSHIICNVSQLASQVAESLGRPGVVKDDARTVFVRNLPFKASEADIVDFFAQAGPVTDVRRQVDDQGLSLTHLSCNTLWCCNGNVFRSQVYDHGLNLCLEVKRTIMV